MSQWIVRQRAGVWYAAGIFIVPADFIIVPFMAAVQLSKQFGALWHYVTIIVLVLLVITLIFGGSQVAYRAQADGNDYVRVRARAAEVIGIWAAGGFLCYWIMSGLFMR
jgi:hypothetical protein